MSNKLSSHKRTSPEKGHVEIFRVTDESYFLIFVDGQEVEFVRSASLSSVMLNSRFRSSLAERAGVAPEDLRYSFSSPFWRAMELGLMMGAYPYEDMIKWRRTHPDQFDFWVMDLEEMEHQFIVSNL